MRWTCCTPGSTSRLRDVEIDARAHRAQHGLARAGGAVHGEAHPDQVFDHLLDLLFGRRFLHCNNHRKLLARQLVGSQSSARL